jgi:hypothetical protein
MKLASPGYPRENLFLGWSLALCSSGPRFIPDGTAPLASVYESAFPADRPAIVDDRQGISDEIVSAEQKAYRKLHGLR